MKHFSTLLLLFIGQFIFAHNHYSHNSPNSHQNLRHWQIGQHQTIDASFSMLKDGKVFLEDEQEHLVAYPLSALSKTDQAYILAKNQQITQINRQITHKLQVPTLAPVYRFNYWVLVLVFGAMMMSSLLYVVAKRRQRKWLCGALTLGVIGTLCSFKSVQSTDIAFLNSAFIPFMPNVHTSWDGTYFYVHSLGIPSHPMMSGITNWQQQVPVPQCYTNNNAWSIPLNPVVAPTPTPTASNFFKGAIAVAANGVPIFNALNNTGTDSYLAGELDHFGGHCGRADDYHYHIAPLSLDSITTDIIPIAFALDGFAVYAGLEPDGSAMATLDANHGHYGSNGVYHYHGNLTYPYMIGNMVGVVTADASGQIVPQAASHPIRSAQTPLPGAAITNCQANGSNGYILTYTNTAQTYTITYSWTSGGQYTYLFTSPTGNTTTQTYTGFTPCAVPANCLFSPLLSGIAVACSNNTYTYSVPAGATGTTYYWTATGGSIASGQGTNSIQVQWANGTVGTVKVVQSNP